MSYYLYILLYLKSTPFPFFVLTEETLMSYSLDSLFVLMVEKIQTIKLLDPGGRAYNEMKAEIKLIEKVISIKESAGKK